MCTSNHPVGTTYASAPTKNRHGRRNDVRLPRTWTKRGHPRRLPRSPRRQPRQLGPRNHRRDRPEPSRHHVRQCRRRCINPGRFPTRSKRWQRTPTPSFRHSISTPSISSRSRWGGLHRPGSSSRARPAWSASSCLPAPAHVEAKTSTMLPD